MKTCTLNEENKYVPVTINERLINWLNSPIINNEIIPKIHIDLVFTGGTPMRLIYKTEEDAFEEYDKITSAIDKIGN